MGLYKKKGSQFYWMSYTVNKRRKQESTKTSNKKLAEKIFGKIEAEIVEGKWFDRKVSTTATMNQVLGRYMAEFSPKLSQSSQVRSGQIFKKLQSFFGQYLLTDISVARVSSYKVALREKGHSIATIRKELGLLRRVFSLAINEWELCKENPVCKVLMSVGKEDNMRVRYLSAEEGARLMAILPLWLSPIVVIARNTGLRRGNILGLTWQDVDLKRKTLFVSKTKNNEPLGIPLNETAVKTFQELSRIRHLHSSYVFCEKDGKPYSPGKVSVAFKRVCRRAAITDFRFHDLRHDFASKLVQADANIYKVMALLGHKDLRMTVRYSHLHPENLRDTVNALDTPEIGYNLVTVGENKKGLLS